MSVDDHRNERALTPSAAISIAIALGIVCCVAGGAVTAYLVEAIEGPRVLQFVWMLVLFFGVPSGFVILQEFTPRAFRNLKSVQLAIAISNVAQYALPAAVFVGALTIPRELAGMAKYVFPIPGLAVVCLAMLESKAMKMELKK